MGNLYVVKQPTLCLQKIVGGQFAEVEDLRLEEKGRAGYDHIKKAHPFSERSDLSQGENHLFFDMAQVELPLIEPGADLHGELP